MTCVMSLEQFIIPPRISSTEYTIKHYTSQDYRWKYAIVVGESFNYFLSIRPCVVL